MRLPQFDLVQPSTFAEAVGMLELEGPDAQVMAGGTDLLVAMKQRNNTPKLLVNLDKLSEHRGIAFDPDTGLRIGALATLTQVANSPVVREHYPALAQAAESVGSPQIRNRGTLGGNLCLDKRCWFYNQSEAWRNAKGLCLRAGGDTCSVVQEADLCYSLVMADTATALMALEADLVVVGPTGQRVLPMSEFFAGLGDDANVLDHAELLAEVHVPMPLPGATSVYMRHAARGAIDFPIIQLAVILQREGNACRQARIVVGAVTPNPMRATKAEEMLAGQKLTPELAHEAAAVAVRQIKPIPYIARTPEYKRLVTRGYLEATILQAAGLDSADGN